MKKLFNSLEALETLDQNDAILEEGDINRLQLLMKELDLDIDRSFEHIEDLFDKISEVNVTINNLENIVMVISEHGICRATMEAFDPNGELVGAGLVVAYEGLPDTPTRDQYVQEAVEGIVDVIKTFYAKVEAFFNKIYDIFKDLGVFVKKYFISVDLEMGNIRKKLKTIKEFDEEKFGKKRARAYSKSDFDKVFGSIGKLVNAVKNGLITKTLHDIEGSFSGKSYDKDKVKDMNDKIASYFTAVNDSSFKEAFGFQFEVSDSGVVKLSSKDKVTIRDSRDEMVNLGWKASDAEALATKCFNTFSSFQMLISLINSSAKSAKAVHKFIGTVRTNFEKMSDDEKAGYKLLVSSSQQHFNLISQLFKQILSVQRSVYYTGLAVGKTAIKCGK